MKFLRDRPVHTRRDAWVDVNLSAVERNARAFRAALGAQTAMMAIVKADAYGHGAATLAPVLQAAGVAMVGVASMDEALHLRRSALTLPILVIGAVPDWAMRQAAEEAIGLTVFDPRHLDGVRQAYADTGKPLTVHVKIDTGMHRIGVPWADAPAFVRQCRATPGLILEGLFSHLACADTPQKRQLQEARFLQTLARCGPLPPLCHLDNTASTLARLAEATPWPEALTMTRLGLGLYGYTGLGEGFTGLTLTPAMGLKARIVHLQSVAAGEGVSYGARFVAPDGGLRLLATLPVGYADGLARGLSQHLVGRLRGQSIPQVGVITMDQLMMDVSALPDVRIGDAVTLLGHEPGDTQGPALTLTPWAQTLDTIEYELMCALRVRLPKIYVRD